MVMTKIFDSEVTIQTKAKVEKLLLEVKATNDKGTWFFRSDTGTGKTTGFIQAVTVNNLRVAIAVPTREDVDNVYQSFVDAGHQGCMKWYQDSGTSKDDAKGAMVVVGTHKWLLGDSDPTGHTGKDRLLIVDEVPSDTTAFALQGSDIARAREIAQKYGLVSTNRFEVLESWVSEQVASDDQRPSYEKMEYLPHKDSFSLAEVEKEIASKVKDEQDKRDMRKVVALLEAASDGRAYKCKGRASSTGGWKVLFAGFKFTNSWFDKQVIFSATSHLDGFQYHKDSDRLKDVDGMLVDYSKLKFTHVPWPDGIDKHARTVVSVINQRELAVAHIQSMFDLGAGPTLIAVPKALKDDVARSFGAEQSGGESYYAASYHGREVYVTNWGRDVGSNAYRDCETVILWSNQYKPKHTTFSELLVVSNEKVDDANLSEVKGGRFTGRPKGLQQGQHLAGIKQMGCRGTARKVDDDGQCDSMHLLMSWDGLDPRHLEGIFPNHQYVGHKPESEKFKPRVTSNQRAEQKVLAILQEHYPDTTVVTLKEVCTWFPKAKDYTKRFEADADLFKMNGWEFVPRELGRYGKGAHFLGKGF